MPAFLESVAGAHMLAFLPQALCEGEWINLMLLPPQPLIAGCVVLLMMNGAERYGEFVADFEPNTSGLWGTKSKCSLVRLGLARMPFGSLRPHIGPWHALD